MIVNCEIGRCETEINGYQVRIVHPKQVSFFEIDTVVYLFAHLKEENCFEKLKAKNIAIVNVLGYDWNRDLRRGLPSVSLQKGKTLREWQVIF